MSNGTTVDRLAGIIKEYETEKESELIQEETQKAKDFYGKEVKIIINVVSIEAVNGTTKYDFLKNCTPLKSIDLVRTNTKVNINLKVIDIETGEEPVSSNSYSLGYTKPIGIYVKGDLTGTGEIDVTDLSTIQQQLVQTIELKGLYNKAADMDTSGDIDIIDLSMLQEYIVNK